MNIDLTTMPGGFIAAGITEGGAFVSLWVVEPPRDDDPPPHGPLTGAELRGPFVELTPKQARSLAMALDRYADAVDLECGDDDDV